MTFPLPGANWSYLHGLTVKESTGIAGFTLQDATPTILTWNVPDDGELHRFHIFATSWITTQQVGGQVTVSFFAPNGDFAQYNLFDGGEAAGFDYSMSNFFPVIEAGTAVTIAQSTALTGGASTLWAEIWGL